MGIQLRHGPHRGRLVIPCDHSYARDGGRSGPADQDGSHVIYSDDHGRTWRLGGVARPEMNESQVIELADGQGGLLLNMRTVASHQRRAQSVSHDGGLTWTPPEPVAELVEPRCQASLVRSQWPGSNGPGRLLFSNPAGPKRTRLTLRVSTDDGRTWPVARVLHEGPAAYSCLAVLPANAVGVLYECGEKKAYEKIVFEKAKS